MSDISLAIRQLLILQKGSVHARAEGSDVSIDLFVYDPSHILPALFAGLVGLSLLVHTYQNW